MGWSGQVGRGVELRKRPRMDLWIEGVWGKEIVLSFVIDVGERRVGQRIVMK